MSIQLEPMSGVETFDAQALKRNGYVVINDRPCKIVEISQAGYRTNKRPYVNLFIIGSDIFTGQKYEMRCKSNEIIKIPNVETKVYDLLDLTIEIQTNGNHVLSSFLSDNGQIREDLKIPESWYPILTEQYYQGSLIEITVVSALGEEQMTSFRWDTKPETIPKSQKHSSGEMRTLSSGINGFIPSATV